VSDAGDAIAAAAEDESVALNTLRWKIGATRAAANSGFQVSPRDALVDTWIYCRQMESFLGDGAGGSLFGTQQDTATAAAARLVADVHKLAGAFVPADQLPRYEEFANT
jgi:hypothetical protein